MWRGVSSGLFTANSQQTHACYDHNVSTVPVHTGNKHVGCKREGKWVRPPSWRTMQRENSDSTRRVSTWHVSNKSARRQDRQDNSIARGPTRSSVRIFPQPAPRLALCGKHPAPPFLRPRCVRHAYLHRMMQQEIKYLVGFLSLAGGRSMEPILSCLIQ